MISPGAATMVEEADAAGDRWRGALRGLGKEALYGAAPGYVLAQAPPLPIKALETRGVGL